MSEETGRRGTRARLSARLSSLALTGLILSACGGGSATPTVASLAGHATGSRASGASLTQSQSDADMVSFTSCMRAHGVQMSDPFHRPGHSGLSIDLPTQDGATASAYHACDHFMAPIIEMKMGHQTAIAAPQLAALTRYAECMRAHDIGMLDPTSFGALSLGNVPGITDSFGRYSPQFRAADATCRLLLPAGVHDDGTGP